MGDAHSSTLGTGSGRRSVGLLAAASGLILLLGVLAVPSLAQENSTRDTPPAKDGPMGPGLHESLPGTLRRSAPASLDLDLGLTSARVESVNLDDTDEEYVVYTLGRVVQEVLDPTGFSLQGYDVDATATATDARLVHGDPTSVLVAYPAGTDIARYTVATVASGTVEDEAGRGNLPGSIPLEGSTAGSSGDVTAAPDLTGARAITSLDRVVYTYDEQLDEQASYHAARFGYSTLDGRMVAGTSVVTADDTTITVQFDRHTADAVAFYALAGAVRDRHGTGSTIGSIGGPTTAPDLVAVSPAIGRTQYDYTFSTAVHDVDLSRFALYAIDGTRSTPSGFVKPGPQTVRVAYPEIHHLTGLMVLAAVEAGAVTADDGSDAPSTVGARRLGSLAPAPGSTSGPGLASVAVDQGTGQIRLSFDQPIDDDVRYAAGNFLVITASGDTVPARFFVETLDTTVLVTFDHNVAAAARAVSVREGAVRNFKGAKNLVRTVNL